jgi:hypothetical protein
VGWAVQGVGEREADVVVAERVARVVREVAVVFCTGPFAGRFAGGTVGGRPGVEGVAPCAVPGAGEGAFDCVF